MGTSLSAARPLLAIGIIGLLLVSIGCHPGAATGEQGSLASPPQGNVRIVTRKIEQTTDKVHWKWSLIGERNWTDARAAGGQMSLEKTYPLNSTSQRGGCNVWECDLTAERGAAPGSVHWTAVLHGSVGTTVRDEGTVPDPGGGPTALVRIEMDHDTVERLPTDLTLADVGGTWIHLRIDR
jgi:hypothetical protein